MAAVEVLLALGESGVERRTPKLPRPLDRLPELSRGTPTILPEDFLRVRAVPNIRVRDYTLFFLAAGLLDELTFTVPLRGDA